MKTSVVVVTLLVMFNSAAVSQTVPGLYSGKPLKLMYEVKQIDKHTVEIHDATSHKMLLVIYKPDKYGTRAVYESYEVQEVEEYGADAVSYGVVFGKGYAKVMTYSGQDEHTVAKMRLKDWTVTFTDKRIKCVIYPTSNDQYGWMLKGSKIVIGIAHKTDPVDILTLLVHIVQAGLE